MEKPILFEKPHGVRDFLPDSAENKRLIEQQIAKSFAKWGYREIITPMFEYIDTFQTGLFSAEERVFKFVDRSGKTVALRADMTAPIARVAASLLKKSPLPIRLSYTSNIFRQQAAVAGRDSEFTQAGVELIGESSPDADAEMIALSVRTLEDLRVEGFRLALGQMGFLHGFLAEHITDQQTRNRIVDALAEKDYVAYERIVKQAVEQPSRSMLLKLPTLRGGVEVLETALSMTQSPKAQAALRNLQEIWSVLEIHDAAKRVQIDLSLLLGLNYYTGAVFEGYAPGVGFPVCGGGRYDELAGKFGRTAPATGFIIGIERILEVLEKKGRFVARTRYLLCYTRDDRVRALKFAEFLRSRDILVSTLLIADYATAAGVDGSHTIYLPDVLHPYELDAASSSLQAKVINPMYEEFSTAGGELHAGQ